MASPQGSHGPNTIPPASSAEEEALIRLAVANDEVFKRLVIIKLSDLSARVGVLEKSEKKQDIKIAVAEDSAEDSSRKAHVLWTVGGLLLAIVTAVGGALAWFSSFFGGKQP